MASNAKNSSHPLNSKAQESDPTEQGSRSVMKRACTWKKEWYFLGCHYLQEMEHRHPAELSEEMEDGRKGLK